VTFLNLKNVFAQLKFPKQRLYPIAFATFLMYLAWHPIGDFVESLVIGWGIVPRELFTGNFFIWFVPFANIFTHSYAFAFFAYFIPITIIVLAWGFIKNKKISYLAIALLIFFMVLVPAFNPEVSVAYKNDIGGFKAHNMQPLDLWMFFHMLWWFAWMVFPHVLGLFTTEKTMLKIAALTWVVFLAIWLSSWATGWFFYIPVAR